MLIVLLLIALTISLLALAFYVVGTFLLKEERAWLLEKKKAAELDALSALADKDEADQKIERLSAHVRFLMRDRAQQQSLQLPNLRVYDFTKTPAQNRATRSAHLN